MTELFTREGTPHEGRTFLDEKDRPCFTAVYSCMRCGGRGGSDAWKFTGWTCYRCNGSGKEEPKVIRLYTAPELARLNATAAKRLATKTAKIEAAAEIARAETATRVEGFLAEHAALLAAAEPFLAKSEFLADVVGKARRTGYLSEKAIAAVERTVAGFAAVAARAPSAHVGTVGERLELPVTVEFVTSFGWPSFSGRGMETVWITKMRTADGDLLVVKSPAFRAEKGETFTVRGTVKEHGEFRDEKETVLMRAAVIAAPAMEEAA